MKDDISKRGQDGVNSHIQMSKLLLKRFHNKSNLLCYYNVEGNFVGTKGTVESLNTEWGYYSVATEHYLRDTIETPFGVVLSYIDTLDFMQNCVSVNSDFEANGKKFHIFLHCTRSCYNARNGNGWKPVVLFTGANTT